MLTPAKLVQSTAWFLVERCRELGFIPLVTKTPPPDCRFDPFPGEHALFIKLFGRFDGIINTVHAKWGVLDETCLDTLGSLGPSNLCLTTSDIRLLILQLSQELKIPVNQQLILVKHQD